MKKNINTVTNQICTGCGVCSTICPKKCIEMKISKNGFYLPKIDEGVCVNCGLCQKVCYKYYKDNKNDKGIMIRESNGYIAYSKNDLTRINSSSGGIGKELTYNAIENGFKVCGVEYNYKTENAQHVIIEKLEDLEKIVGSKYIPSYTNTAFDKLEKNQKYIIIGTPCQIYGLRKLKELKRLSEDVLLVDFFCHGTPSLNLWNKYLKMIKKQLNIKKIEKVNFRDKKLGWHNYSMFIQGEGKEYRLDKGKDLFLQFFLENLDLNTPCYNCKFRFNKLFSDIRLGDFWGSRCKKDKKGVSLVLTNTNYGDESLKRLNGIHVENVTFLDIKESQYCKAIKIPEHRNELQRELNSNASIIEIYNKFLIPIKRRKKQKEIITYPYRKFKGLLRRCKRCMKREV